MRLFIPTSMHIEDTGAHTDDIIALQAIELSRIRGQLQEARNEQLMRQTVIVTYGLQMLSAAMIRDCLKRSNEDLKGQLEQSQNDLTEIQARNEELLAELSELNDASVALQDQLRTSEAEWATSVNQLGTQLFDAHCNQGALEMRISSLEEELCKVQKEKCIIEEDLAAACAAQSGSREESPVTEKEPRNCIWTEQSFDPFRVRYKHRKVPASLSLSRARAWSRRCKKRKE
ncbi:hypothetical protein A0H81_13386 [Grifola frondosa]|uniref:Uncharacterized protein n=1 Tax=Grifola frondosa TaxID=5627 RepID=A0A1C7LR59_GRIFR|nr:hypothetical protein A0H81_13386 [Grifola frondosa]